MSSNSKLAKILVTNPLHDEVHARLAAVGSVDMNPYLEPWSAAELAARIADADAMMGFMTDCVDRSLLQSAPHLRIVACALKGFDSYDVKACTGAGIWVSIVPDLLTEPTAELGLGLAIALGRHVRRGDHLVRSGQFQGWRAQLYGRGLQGSVVAVVGMGRVGQAIVQRLSGFGCARILGVDPQGVPATLATQVKAAALGEAMAQADFVFVAVPLSAGALHLIGHRCLESGKPGQLLINVGRGSVVDEEAVADALEDGQLGGYASDVYAMEDWGLSERPRQIPVRLLSHPATVFTPHLGSAVREVRIAIEHRAADNIIAALQGKAPPDAINQPVRVAA